MGDKNIWGHSAIRMEKEGDGNGKGMEAEVEKCKQIRLFCGFICAFEKKVVLLQPLSGNGLCCVGVARRFSGG